MKAIRLKSIGNRKYFFNLIDTFFSQFIISMETEIAINETGKPLKW